MTFEATTREESWEHEAKLEQDIRLYFAYHHHNTVLDLLARVFFITFMGHISIGASVLHSDQIELRFKITSLSPDLVISKICTKKWSWTF